MAPVIPPEPPGTIAESPVLYRPPDTVPIRQDRSSRPRCDDSATGTGATGNNGPFRIPQDAAIEVMDRIAVRRIEKPGTLKNKSDFS